MAKEIKMADLAKELGVSTVTVSKALSGQKGVSEQMRKKIKELADQRGYLSPAMAREEARESYNIGVVVSDIYIAKYQTFYWEFYQKITTRAVQDNCFVILEVLSKENESADILPKMVTENKIDGLIILGGIGADYLKNLKDNSKLPVVYMDFYNESVKEDCVISNSYYGSYHMTNYLFSQGHKQIGFVGTVDSTESIMDRYLGYMKSMMEHGEKVCEEWVLRDRDDKALFVEEIKLPKKMPTAFVCNCDLTAAEMIKTLAKAGYRVPEDVSLVGYDDYLFPGVCDIGITTYAVDMEQMAAEGIAMLVDKIGNGTTKQGMSIVEGKIVVRDSVKNLK